MFKLLPLLFALIMHGCMSESTLEVSGEGAEQARRDFLAEFDRPNVTNVYVENNQLIIEGSQFHHVDKIRIKGTGDQAFDDEFTIQSKGKNKIIANSKRNISYLVGAMFDMVLSNAYGAATYAVSFTIPDGGVTGKKINRMTANDGEVLAWNATEEEWEPAALNSINVLGAWDPVANNDPEIVTGGYQSLAPPSAGDFWVVTQAADLTGSEINGIDTFGAGDWIFWDQTKNAGAGSWIRVQNTQQVTRVNTKTGDVTLGWNDIPKTGSSVDDLEDVDTTSAAPSTGQVLKWDGSNWTPQTDDSTSYTGVVNGTAIQNGSITNEDINATAAIETSKIDGLDTALADRLTLSTGGTMAGDIDMGNNSISNINLVDGENINQMRTDINSNASVLGTAFGSNTLSYVRGNGTPATLNTDVVPEGSTNYWFTVERVRGTPLTGFSAGADVAVNDTDTVMQAIGKLQSQVTTAKSDAAGGGDFLADGTVNMSGDFNAGGNDLNNVGSLTTSTLIDSQGLFIASGLWGSNVTAPEFQFEMQDDAAGLTLVSGTAASTRGDLSLTISGFNAQTEFANGDYIYLHGIPYKVSNRPNSTTITLDIFMPYSAQDMVVHKGKAGIAFFDSGRKPVYSFDMERGDMRLGTYAATNESSSRIEGRTVSRTAANGTHDTNMLLLENRSYVVDTFTNSGEQSVAKFSAYRNSFTDGAPEDEGTLALQKILELNYGHKNASGTASSLTTTMKAIEINAFNQAGSITNSYDIHVTEPTGAIAATNNYGIVVEGTDKTNILEGTLEVGGEGLTAAQGGTKMLVNGNIELLNGGIFYGDGSGLTGISASGATSADDNAIIADSDNNADGDILFKIGTGGSERQVARVDYDGNFGIGVGLDPTHKLEVVGDTQLDVTNGDGVFFDLAGATVFGMEEVGTSGTVHFGNENNLDSGLSFRTSTGAVGVGTNVPRGIFEVSDVLYDDGNCSDNPGYSGADIDGDADSTDCRKTGLVVAADANVGVGTTSPSVEFEVNGHIKSDNVNSFYASRTLGTSVNDTVDLGDFTGVTNIVEMSVVVGETAKTYRFTLNEDSDTGTTKIIRPYYSEFDNNASPTDNFDLLGDYNTGVLSLRVRRTVGTTTALEAHIKSLTSNAFAHSTTSGFSAAAAYHNGSPLRMVGDNTRMGTSLATNEHLAVSVGSTVGNPNFALTNTSADPTGFEFRISAGDLFINHVTTMNSSPTMTANAEFQFADDGTFTANALTGNGSGLTDVTAATVTDPGTEIVFTVDNDNGTPVDTSKFTFKNGSTATEVLTIDGDGNMGINATDITTETYTNIPSSSATFDRSLIVQGEGGVTGSNTAGKGTLVLSNSKRGVAGTGILSSTEAGAIEFVVAGNEGGTTGAGSGDVDDDIDSGDTIAYMISGLSGSGSDDGASYTDGYGGKISFYTKADNSLSVLERFTIDHTGDVNVATGAASIRIGGTEVCTSAGCPSPSDERLKENVEPLKDSLMKLLALEGVSYNWINTEKYGERDQIGFLAQQLEMFFPEVVNTDNKTGLKSVSYGHLVAPMVEALKEHNAMIENNKAMFETMSDRIEAIEAHNEQQDREIASLKEENKMLKSYICSKDPDAPFCQ
jgi:hypothetical protein